MQHYIYVFLSTVISKVITSKVITSKVITSKVITSNVFIFIVVYCCRGKCSDIYGARLHCGRLKTASNCGWKCQGITYSCKKFIIQTTQDSIFIFSIYFCLKRCHL